MGTRGVGGGVLVVVLCCIVGLAMAPAPVGAAGPEGMEGSGNPGDPYEITNAAQLQAMDQNPDAHYELVEDIDANATATWNGGSGFEPIATGGDFTGTFDGNGHAIVGLTINRSGSNQVGLFSSTDGSELSDVRLLDVDVTGGRSTGALVGNNYVDLIADVFVSGSVSGTEDVGGVVGFSGGEIRRSASTADVDGQIEVGGLLGYASGATVTDSYATGDVTAGQEDAGGLVGYNYGTVKRSYATGSASGSPAGGLLGYSSFNGELDTSYWNTDVDGSAVGENKGGTVHATGRSTAQLTGLNATDALPEFDFGTDWATTDDYPTLRAVAIDRTPAFEIASIDVDASVDANSTMTVDATIRNVGTGDGTLPVELAADGTPAVDSEVVSLPAGVSKQVTLAYEVPGSIDTGSFDVAISTPNETVERTVDVDGYETFSGTLTDGATGEPASAATVTVAGDSETQTVQTDASGYYQLAVLNDSTVTVSATPTVATPDGQESITGSISATVDGTTTGVDLTLWPALDGAGTTADAFEIATARELQAMQQDLSANYALVDDVDASATAGWNDGAGFDPVGTSYNDFSGAFDGDGYVIDGLTINRSGGAIGLFRTNSGTITNVSLTDVAVTGDPDESTVGSVVGENYGVVTQSSVSSGLIEGRYGGGIAGTVGSSASVTDSYANVTVNADQNAGGLAGTNYGTIATSYATGVVTLGDTDDRVGGIVGYNQGSVSDSYWNQDSDGDATSGVGKNADTVTDVAGRTTAEMTGANAMQTMNGLAFDTTWIALDGEYPALSRQVASYDLSLASNEIAVDGGSADATVTVGLQDGTTATATTTSTYATGGNVSATADGTVTADAYGPDTVTATAGGFSDAVAVTALDADYEIAFTDAPATVAAGESYWINASVENVGNDAGSDNVSFAFDNATFYDESTTVGAGATEPIAVEYTVPEDAATGGVALNATTPDDDASRSVHVNGYETLSGTVTDGVTGDALSGLTVTIDDGTSTRTVTTDASGAYSIEIRNASSVDVSATTTMNWGDGPVAIAGSNATTIASSTRLDLALFQTLPGSGTANDPYRIDTAAELQTVNQDLTANYALVDDVNASGTADWNDGAGFEPIGQDVGRFSGTFDGDGNEIENLTIDRPGENYVGLFAETNGTIHDVALANASVVGDLRVGGIVGLGSWTGQIRNATVSGTVRGSGDVGGLVGDGSFTVTNASSTADVTGSWSVGGLVGNLGGGSIDRSWASGTVTGTSGGIGGLIGESIGYPPVTNSWASGDVIGDGATGSLGGLAGSIHPDLSNVSATGDVTAPEADEVGGLIGTAAAGDVTNTWASGNVTGDEEVGGLIGSAYDASRSYATGTVTGNASVGGAIGYVPSSDSTTDVYWDVNASGQNASAGNATGLTTAQLTGPAANGSLTGFDFENTWTLTDGYPRLQAAAAGLDLSVDDRSLRPGDSTAATVALDLVGGESITASTVANYTVSDPRMVAIDGGTIDAVGTGTATISATLAGVNDSVTVSVDAPPDDPDDDPGGPTSVERVGGSATGFGVAVENAERGDVIAIDGETAGNGSGDRLLGAGNASIDSIAIEMAQDRDFALDLSGSPDAPAAFAVATGSAPLGTLRVDHDLYPADVESVTFTYTVSRERLDAAGAGSDDVALHRLADGEWERLPATRTRDTDANVTFESVSPGFSTFAIGADAAVFEVADVGIDAEAVDVGEPVTVTTTVENVGRTDGRFGGSLLVDGTVVANRSVDVEAGGSQNLSATHTFEQPGSYDLCLEGSCVTVTVAGADDSGRDQESSSDEVGNGRDDGLPGFGAVAALVAIAVAAVRLLRRS